METLLENEVKSQEEVLHRFTVEDFQLMDRAGVFPPDSRLELLEGKIYDMSPIGPFHEGVCDLLTEYFVKASNGRWIVRVQHSIHLASDSLPQPDLVLARPAPHRYKMRHPAPEDIFLVVEIAQTSLLHDDGYKRPLYARAGITEVWIVDLNDEVLRVFRKPDGETYTERQELRAGQFASMEMFSDVKVDVAELFKRVL
jgi:Uma2 family endonuclease